MVCCNEQSNIDAGAGKANRKTVAFVGFLLEIDLFCAKLKDSRREFDISRLGFPCRVFVFIGVIPTFCHLENNAGGYLYARLASSSIPPSEDFATRL